MLRINIPNTVRRRVVYTGFGVTLGCILAIAFLSHIAGGPSRNQPQPPPAHPKNTVSVPKKAVPSPPNRLEIPRLHIAAQIKAMGLTADGAMEAPNNTREVGWYKFGPRPGERGSAVIAGHYGSGSNRGLSVFDELHTLNPGDFIRVINEKGTALSFVAREFRIYDADAVAAAVFVSNDNKSHLNIVTCTGVWDKTRQTYSQRLVLFADKQ